MSPGVGMCLLYAQDAAGPHGDFSMAGQIFVHHSVFKALHTKVGP